MSSTSSTNPSPTPLAAPATAAAPPAVTSVSAADLPLAAGEEHNVDLIWSGVMVLLLAVVFTALELMPGVSVPVFLALASAYAANPVVTALEKRRISRTHGTLFVFVTTTALLVGFGLYVVPTVAEQLVRVPEFLERASVTVVPWLREKTGIELPELLGQQTGALGSNAASVLKNLGPAVAKLLPSFASNTFSAVAVLFSAVVVPVLAFFFLADFPRIVAAVRSLIPRREEPLVLSRFREVNEVLSAFIRGQITVGAILSVIYCAGLSAARIEMAIVIGCVAGFGNMVPYVGTAIGVSLALLGVMLSWHGPWQLVVIAVTFGVAQASEGLFITPRIVGSKVGLPPVAIIVAILGFAELFGFKGVLLAVPSSAVLKVVARVVLARYKKTQFYAGVPTP